MTQTLGCEEFYCAARFKNCSHALSHRTPLFDDRTRTRTFPTQIAHTHAIPHAQFQPFFLIALPHIARAEVR